MFNPFLIILINLLILNVLWLELWLFSNIIACINFAVHVYVGGNTNDVAEHNHSDVQEGDLPNLPPSFGLYLTYLPAVDATWKWVTYPFNLHFLFFLENLDL